MKKQNIENLPSNIDIRLHEFINSDTFDIEDVRKLYEHMEKEKMLSSYTFPTKQSSDGFYHIYVVDDTKKTGRRQLKAKTIDELKSKVLEYEKGIHGHVRKTFKDVFNITLDEKIKYIKNPEKLLSVQNSINKYKSEYKRFFANTDFEKKYIDMITKKDIENICLLNLNRYNISIKPFLSMRSLLKSVFDLAYSEYWISENHYKHVNFKKFNDMLTQPVPTSERVHSEDELNLILNYLNMWQKEKPFYLPSYALELQILMGLRRGEVPPLMWSDITNEYILISREQITIKKIDKNKKASYMIVNHTKNYKNRKFPITNDLRDLLNRLKVVHSLYYPDSKYLFPSDNEMGVFTNPLLYQFYRRICKKLGIKINPEVIKGTHSFRRNAITKVVNSSNGNIILASQLFGNTPEVARKNYYSGIDMNEALRVLNQ